MVISNALGFKKFCNRLFGLVFVVIKQITVISAIIALQRILINVDGLTVLVFVSQSPVESVLCGWEVVIIIIIAVDNILNVTALCQINLKTAAVKGIVGFCGSIAKLLLQVV